MFKKFIQSFLHFVFLVSRPLTLGVRGICCDVKNNKVLLVKHTYSEEWALPGGGVEVGESSKTALKREFLEEVGIICEEETVIDVYQNKSISRRDHVIIFLINHWTEKNIYDQPKLEISNVKWFFLDDLPKNITPCSSYAIKKYIEFIR